MPDTTCIGDIVCKYINFPSIIMHEFFQIYITMSFTGDNPSLITT